MRGSGKTTCEIIARQTIALEADMTIEVCILWRLQAHARNAHADLFLSNQYPILGYFTLLLTIQTHSGFALRKKIYTETYQAFLSRLREARKERGLTQIEAGLKLGKPQSYVTKCESGERRVDIVELADFARLYEKPLDYFLS